MYDVYLWICEYCSLLKCNSWREDVSCFTAKFSVCDLEGQVHTDSYFRYIRLSAKWKNKKRNVWVEGDSLDPSRPRNPGQPDLTTCFPNSNLINKVKWSFVRSDHQSSRVWVSSVQCVSTVSKRVLNSWIYITLLSKVLYNFPLIHILMAAS